MVNHKKAENHTGTTINRLFSQNYHDKLHGDSSLHYSLYDNLC